MVGKEGLSFPFLPVYNPDDYPLDHQVRRKDGRSRLRSRGYQRRFGPTASVAEIRAGASRSGRGAGAWHEVPRSHLEERPAYVRLKVPTLTLFLNQPEEDLVE